VLTHAFSFREQCILLIENSLLSRNLQSTQCCSELSKYVTIQNAIYHFEKKTYVQYAGWQQWYGRGRVHFYRLILLNSSSSFQSHYVLAQCTPHVFKIVHLEGITKQFLTHQGSSTFHEKHLLKVGQP
jgi:hypothetical protein